MSTPRSRPEVAAAAGGLFLLCCAYVPLSVGLLLLSRFAHWPALLSVAALAALLGARHRLGWGLLGGAVAAKLWPLVLVPLVLVWSYRAGRIRAALAGLVVAAAV